MHLWIAHFHSWSKFSPILLALVAIYQALTYHFTYSINLGSRCLVNTWISNIFHIILSHAFPTYFVLSSTYSHAFQTGQVYIQIKQIKWLNMWYQIIFIFHAEYSHYYNKGYMWKKGIVDKHNCYTHAHKHTHTHTLSLSLSLLSGIHIYQYSISLPLTHTHTHKHTNKPPLQCTIKLEPEIHRYASYANTTHKHNPGNSANTWDLLHTTYSNSLHKFNFLRTHALFTSSHLE